MNEFYNAEYLSERLAAVCKERDDLRKELHETKSELVHCRDCKHRGTDECPRYRVEIVTWQNDELMPEWDEIEHDSTWGNGFCDRGERKETDT